MKLKLVYFTFVDISSDIHGGTICCRNQIKRLSTDTGIELFVVVAGPQNQEADSLFYLESLGVSSKFVILTLTCGVVELTFLQKFVLTPCKAFANNQSHVDQAVIDAIVMIGADMLLIDYFYSAMFCPEAIKKAPKTVLLTHNREIEFYRDSFKHYSQARFKMFIKRIRLIGLWLTEQSIFRIIDKIIALSPPDVPKRKGMYITPYLDMKAKQWKPNLSRTIFFIGNISHYPNKEAIEYIITKLAPTVTAILPDVRFKIIGASDDDVSFHHSSVDLLGNSDAYEVEQQFLNSQLLICPVKNTFGMKFKMAEALSYGTPFLASQESMLCVPYLQDQPSISLENPVQAARVIVDSIFDQQSTINLATSINFRHHKFVDSQKNIWSRSLKCL